MKKKLSLILSLLLMTAPLSACSSSAPENKEPKETPAAEQKETNEEAGAVETDAFPVTIKHAFGETVIEEKPERVVTLAFGNQDVVLALDIVPVGFSAANYGVQDDSGMLPWTQEKLAALGETNPNVFQDTDGFDYEAIAACDPDIILMPYSGLNEEEYKLLSEIAPVVAYPEGAWTISTEDWIRVTAKALGVEEKGEELVKKMNDTIAAKVAEHPELSDSTFVWISFDANDLSNLHAYSPVDTRCAFLYQFGLKYPESVNQYITEDSYSLAISSENADILYDTDFLIGYSSQEAYDAAAADPVLGEIPALKKNAVVAIDSGTPLSAALTITPLSFDYCIDEYIDKIVEAIGHAKSE